jgi:hypothetical protein
VIVNLVATPDEGIQVTEITDVGVAAEAEVLFVEQGVAEVAAGVLDR